jgi:hypothetical protein
MKKFAAMLMIVAVCAFSIGCGGKSGSKSGSKTDSAKTKTDKTP